MNSFWKIQNNMDLNFLIFSREFNHTHKDQFKKFSRKKTQIYKRQNHSIAARKRKKKCYSLSATGNSLLRCSN